MVFRFDREALPGFVTPHSYLQADGVELLSPAGSMTVVPYSDIKAVRFVREFGATDLRKEMRLFTSRPKLEGLWVRLRFRDGDVMDGILPSNLLLLDSTGFSVVPPDPGNQNQKLFLPRQALSEIVVLGVVGGARRGKRPVTKEQLEMFGQ